MPIEFDIPTWDQGKRLEHDDLNKLGQAVRQFQAIFGDNFLERAGQTPFLKPFDYFVGVVKANGGSVGIPNYTDGKRCYVDRGKPKETVKRGDVFDATAETIGPKIVTATNLANLPDGGTMPPAGTIVFVVNFWTRGVNGADPASLYVFYWQSSGSQIKFGKLAVAWPAVADHNLVTLTPCVSASNSTTLTDSTGAALPNVTAYVQTPIGSTPYFFAVNVGDVVAYFTDGDGNNILLHAPVPGTNALYDVVSIVAVAHAKGVGGAGPLRAQ